MPKLLSLPASPTVKEQRPAATPRLDTTGPRLSVAAPPGEKDVEDGDEPSADLVAVAARLTRLGAARNIYSDVMAFSCMLHSGAVCLVRGSFLLELHAERKPVLPRQALPDWAFWDAELAMERLALSSAKNFQGPSFLYALSYRWLTAEHPDPQGFHLGLLAETLKKAVQAHGAQEEVDVDNDVAVFWDFMSLPQSAEGHARTPEESAIYHRGLSQMMVIFGHRASCVVAQPELPPGRATRGRHSYAESAWCYFEASLSLFAKDLPPSLERVACPGLFARPVPPPVPPAPCVFLAQLLSKRLSQQRDLCALEEMYSASFSAMVESTMELHFDGVALEDFDLSELAAVINGLKNCKLLNLNFARSQAVGEPWKAESMRSRERWRARAKRPALSFDVTKTPTLGTQVSWAQESQNMEAAPKRRPLVLRQRLRRGAENNELSKEFRRSLGRESTQRASQQISNVAPLASALCSNKSVLVLFLRGQAVQELGDIADMLRENSVLQALDLRENRIQDVSPLSEALRVNRTLTVLNLGYQNIRASSLQPLAKALKVNQGLLKLHLSSIKLKDASCITEALEENDVLQVLHLRFNQLPSAEPFEEMLKKNKALKVLDLGGNEIADTAPLASALLVNRSLQELLLSGNRIEDVSELAKALNVNLTMWKLDLSCNHIHNVTSLAVALQWNTSLRELSLQRNHIREGTRLAQALRINHTLTRVDLRYNLIQETSALEDLEEADSSALSDDESGSGSDQSFSLVVAIAPQRGNSLEVGPGSGCSMS